MESSLQRYNLKDTIAAIATFPSPAALGIIKISGKKALAAAVAVFVPKNRESLKKARSHTLHYGWVVKKAKAKGEAKIIDEVLISIMRAPNSYTREDVVEISSHGGVLVLNNILNLLLKRGIRLAFPGEFSYRAFMNGRIDLVQAQAISDIVEAKTEKSLFSLSKQLKGDFSKEIHKIKERLKNIFSYMEAFINFPEEETSVDLNIVKTGLKDIKERINIFLSRSSESNILREGVRCVICGKANVGKSTLFNHLLREERVIVTHIAGTTRDVIEETMNIKGVPLRIYDTAGIVKPKDFLDKEAMKKSHEKLDAADIVICVFDYSRKLLKEDILLAEKIKDKNVIFVVNKIDLKKKINIERLRRFKKPVVRMSALNNGGLEGLEQTVFNKVYAKGITRKGSILLLSQWQRGLLKSIKAAIEDSLRALQSGYPVDFINFSLKPALESLGKLTGEVISEEVLNNIFSNFCIGK